MKNVAFIYEPHFNTSKFRVAMKDQKGDTWNYIIVTCSPAYNGVWEYDATKVSTYETCTNNHLRCYCVPIEDCDKIGELTELKNKDIIKVVKKQQSDWLENKVTNRNYTYKKGKPDWML